MTISYKPNKGNKRYWVILLLAERTMYVDRNDHNVLGLRSVLVHHFVDAQHEELGPRARRQAAVLPPRRGHIVQLLGERSKRRV